MLKDYLIEVKKRCMKNDLDPTAIPHFSKIPRAELLAIQERYKERLAIIRSFMYKFIEKNKEIPIFVTVTDDKGNFIEYLGARSLEETIVHQVGLDIGVQFREEIAGVSSVIAAIELKRPVQTIGNDHYHHFLHQSACYSVPLFLNSNLIGTISIMTFLEHAHPMILTSLETVADFIERELELLEENNYLDEMNQMILKQSNTGYVVVESNGLISKVNPKAQVLLQNVKENETYVQDIQLFGTLYDKYKNNDQIKGQKIVLGKDSESITCLVDFLPFSDGCLIQVNDISEFQKTEYYIQNSEKLSMVGQLAAGVAHEIKNPLTTLKGFIQLIQKNEMDTSYANVMLKEIERINDITNEFLVLSKPTVHHKVWQELSQLLKEVEVLISSFAIEKNVSIKFQFIDSPTIFCDSNQLKQVIINVVKNSVEAVAKNGQITITVQSINDNYVLLRIEDNGGGFPNHILRKIGEPFVTTKKNGNGLGIMVCKRIVENIHQGKLHTYNHSFGGAVVDVILPINEK